MSILLDFDLLLRSSLIVLHEAFVLPLQDEILFVKYSFLSCLSKNSLCCEHAGMIPLQVQTYFSLPIFSVYLLSS